jgi:2-phospho-L-lactate transferase/gluconeogenesis factor (CofD/UPF0052 family)
MYKMKDILNSYTVPELRVLARSHNKEVKIAGINKLKKPELIEAMMKHEDKFKKVQMKVKAKVVKKVYDTETDVSDDEEEPKKQPVKKQRKKAEKPVKKEEMKVKAKVVKSPAGKFGFKKKATPKKK